MKQSCDKWTLSPGRPYPLGATWRDDGINFALTAPHARAVQLCLFDDSGEIELQQLFLPVCDAGVWHGLLPFDGKNLAALVYGYRVHGEYAPEQGHRFNPAKVLLDPYAREIVGNYLGQEAFQNDHPADTAAIAFKARIYPPAKIAYDWGDDLRPRITPDNTVLYEMHVRGFTRLHPAVPEVLRGTYAGVAHPAALAHLKALGITTVNLLPVHHRADEAQLQRTGRSNYWGYSSIGFFAPEPRYWSRQTGTTVLSEFRDMVKALHRAGIEVVLDVVYNHTGETDENGPTLSFRGVDNLLYYHLQPGNLAAYENWTGCGNALKLSEPRVLQLVMDSLRYWVEEMHVDGFRFDLAPILARDAQGYARHAAFFAAVLQDPVLAGVKLTAEPWDIGPGGYQLGNFPQGWHEWNDRYRDTIRAFWLRRSVSVGDFAHCLTGSSNVFQRYGRSPSASVNFITAHDGFTLADLVSYAERHNEENGEDNRDGHRENLSNNCGVEGLTDDPDVLRLRGKLRRALLATLFFSQGTPMLLAGDELGNSQGGNNNAYCQDNAIGWLDWNGSTASHQAFVQRIIGLRAQYPALRHDRWHGAEELAGVHAGVVGQGFLLTWFAASGKAMCPEQWQARDCLGVHMRASTDERDCLLLFNADSSPRAFTLPEGHWQCLLDSSCEDGQPVVQALTQSAMVAEHTVIMAVTAPPRLEPFTPALAGRKEGTS